MKNGIIDTEDRKDRDRAKEDRKGRRERHKR
jgi:hypothetical protein